MAIDRMSPNLMGRNTGFQVMTLGPDDNVWQERGEYADFSHRDAWPIAVSSKNTWEGRGHSVRIYELTLTSGKLVYETPGA